MTDEAMTPGERAVAAWCWLSRSSSSECSFPSFCLGTVVGVGWGYDHAHHAPRPRRLHRQGPDIAPMKFKSRRQAEGWCKIYHPASSVTEIGPGGKRAAPQKRERPGSRKLKHSVK